MLLLFLHLCSLPSNSKYMLLKLGLKRENLLLYLHYFALRPQPMENWMYSYRVQEKIIDVIFVLFPELGNVRDIESADIAGRKSIITRRILSSFFIVYLENGYLNIFCQDLNNISSLYLVWIGKFFYMYF